MKKTILTITAVFVLGLIYKNTNAPEQNERVVKSDYAKTVEEVYKSSHTKQVLDETQHLEQPKATDKQDNGFKSQKESFQKLNRVVLKTEEQTQEFHSLISNRSFIDQNYLIATSINPNLSLKQNVSRSIKAIDALHAALSWDENPIRNDVVENVKYMFFQDILSQTDDLQLKKALAGNQIELYISLTKNSPETAAEVKKYARGKRLAHLIQMAEDYKN